MTDTEKLTLLISEFRALAARSTRYEENAEFNPADDGNFNDAYSAGVEDGIIIVARNILNMIEALST